MEQAPLMETKLTSRKPEKWVIVDTETNEAYGFDLRYASDELIQKALESITSIIEERKNRLTSY